MSERAVRKKAQREQAEEAERQKPQAVPRRLHEVRVWLRDSPPKVGETRVPSRSAAEVMGAEICEACGALPSTINHETEKTFLKEPYLFSMSCLSPTCKFTIGFKYDKNTDDWLLKKYDGHNCAGAGGAGSSKGKRQCAYKPKHLAPLLMPSFRDDVAEPPSGKDMSNILAPYCKMVPNTEGIVKRAKERALEELYGSPELQIAALEPLVDYLNEIGHKATIFSVGKSSQVLLAKKLHDDKKISAEQLAERLAELNEFDDDAEFFHSIHVKTKWMAQIQSHLKSLYQMDACHVGGSLDTATAFSTWRSDANRHLLNGAFSYCADNERTLTWTQHLTFLNDEATPIEEDAATISDSDKGASAAMDVACPAEMLKFKCYKHVYMAAAKKALGTGDLNKYSQAVGETSLQLWKFYVDGMSTKGKNFFGKYNDDELYLVHTHGRTHGRRASAGAESMNFATAAMRNAVGPVGAVLAFIAGETRRYNDHRAAALACDTPLPPKGMQRIAEVQIVADNFDCRRAGASAYIVTEKILSGATHTVTITTGEMPKCSCGGPQATREPCEHVIIVADKFALPLDSIVHRTDTTAAWKAMYEAGGEPPAYSSAAWRPPHRALGTLEVPVVFRAARLRRRAEPRKKSKVEIATASRARMHRRKEDRQAAQAAQTSGANARRNVRAPERLNL